MTTSPSIEATQPAFSSNFAFDDADICLKTSDNVVFKVHRWPLSSASEVFRDMFTFGSCEPPAFQDLPIVYISEDSRTTDLLLQFICPQFDIPELQSMIEVDRLLIAADKYNIRRIANSVKQQMTNHPSLCDDNIFLAYLIAKDLDLRDMDLLQDILRRLFLLDWREDPGRKQLLSVLDSQRLSAVEYLDLDSMQRGIAFEFAMDTVNDHSLWRMKDASAGLPAAGISIMAGGPEEFLKILEGRQSHDNSLEKLTITKLKDMYSRIVTDMVVKAGYNI